MSDNKKTVCMACHGTRLIMAVKEIDCYTCHGSGMLLASFQCLRCGGSGELEPKERAIRCPYCCEDSAITSIVKGAF
jgi:DNA-directed RNA polymerase subunit RPC12/RpoP